MWTDRQQTAFEALKACLISAPILGFPTEDGRFLLDTDASLFAVGGGGGGVLNQIQDDREVVIAYASRSFCLSQQRYCTTRREMLAAVVMCTHFRSYLRGAQITLRMDHSSLRWLQKFFNEDGMLARWYLLLGQSFGYFGASSGGSACQCGWNVSTVWTVSETGLSGFLFGFAGGRIGYLVGHSGSVFRLVGNGRLHGRRLAVGNVGGDLGGSHVIGGTYGGLASGRLGY